jgi:hypothetical protein
MANAAICSYHKKEKEKKKTLAHNEEQMQVFSFIQKLLYDVR